MSYIYTYTCINACLLQFAFSSLFHRRVALLNIYYFLYIYIYTEIIDACTHSYISINKPFLHAAVVSNLFTFFHRLIYIGDKNNIYMCMHV